LSDTIRCWLFPGRLIAWSSLSTCSSRSLKALSCPIYDGCWFWRSYRLCKGGQEFVRITAQRMVSNARLLFQSTIALARPHPRRCENSPPARPGSKQLRRRESLGDLSCAWSAALAHRISITLPSAAVSALAGDAPAGGGLVKETPSRSLLPAAMSTRASVMCSNSRVYGGHHPPIALLTRQPKASVSLPA